ncbi:uncharacterized protein Gasu_02000 [Galdieria sulphuraria]|uniref:HTH La-type RNA-binding domain-containing protein n=1 Tax=Galdieria sulphuraria TaxID=130081 RepID=M2Y9X1_GALSU|nr:uncharacterized protein Gasu_02000 [Galdieria sulphuraria]EME32848.1 hypothetical protein Gasu_02000 [Galdieria sulphuraria]|eukprot:XP_005709368.1 hypothetical protein Gasu_02000 [Galdieria sulphuraria]
MHRSNVHSVTTETVYGRERNSDNLKDDTVSQKNQDLLESKSRILSEELSSEDKTWNSVNKDSPEPLDGVNYPYSRLPSSSFSPVSTPYMAHPSPFIAAPYCYPMFPATGVISPGVPLSNYPFTLEMAIVHQIEYYLGEENLAKDIYLRQLMDPEMWVEIEKLVTFPKLSRLTTSVRLVARVLREFSFRIQVHDDDERVRPMPPDNNEDRCLVIVKNISGNVAKEDFLNYIQQAMGKSTKLKILSSVEDTWFIYCVSESDAERLCSSLNSLSFHGNILEARRKMDDSVRHTEEFISDVSYIGRQATSSMTIPNSWASQLPFQSSAFSFPSLGASGYVPMNAGFYAFPFSTYPYVHPVTVGVTDTSRNARVRRRGNNRAFKGNTEKDSTRVSDNEVGSERKATVTEFTGQMSSTRIPNRIRAQEKNLKNKTFIEDHHMNGNLSSGNNSQQVTNHSSRSYGNISEKYPNSSKGKNTNEPNLSLAEFPPLPSTDGKNLNSLFKSGKPRMDTVIVNGTNQFTSNGSETLNAKETKVFLERDSNVCYEDTDKASVPVLSFGDLVLCTENLSETQTHESF